MYSSHKPPPPAFARPAAAHRAVARESRHWSDFLSDGGELTVADYLLRKENTCRCELAVPIRKLAERRASAHRSCPTACRTCAAAAPWRCARCSCAGRSARLDHLEQEVDAGPPPAATCSKCAQETVGAQACTLSSTSAQPWQFRTTERAQLQQVCERVVRKWFALGLIVELCSCIISWPCSSSMVMAVSSTSSGSGSDLGDQLWLDESTNSKKEEGYTVGKGLPHRVALGDLPTSSRGAV